jgi:hypothetical protein
VERFGILDRHGNFNPTHVRPLTQTVSISPSQSQFDFIADIESKYVFMFGGKGSGKSYAGTLFALHMVSMFPGSQGLLMWNTLGQAKDMFRQDMEPRLKELGWRYKYNEQAGKVEVEGCVIHLRSAEPDANEKIESVQYSWGWADEASFYPPESLRRFVSRIRKDKGLVRISSMPDDPDAFIYTFADNIQRECEASGIGFKLFEVNLNDNPDPDFRKQYEMTLRSTYEGEQLRRYLNGERVSLAGLGAFRVAQDMIGAYPYDPNKDLYLSWDFNVEYRAITAWQEQGVTPQGHKSVACVKAWQMKEATIADDAVWLCDALKSHKALITLDGDASGDAKTPMATMTAWGAIKQTFQTAFAVRIRYAVASHNPNVQNTIQCANWALTNGLVGFDTSAKACYNALVACRLDKSGSIDKSKDNAPSGARTHEADTARYALWHYFRRAYPGNNSKYFVV